MTTDTAVRVTRMVVESHKGSSHLLESLQPARLTASTLVPLQDIPYLDFPELRFDDHESTQMPFRYVKGEDGNPVMPEVCNPNFIPGPSLCC